MRTLRVLLSKDLLRAIRNPAAWIVFLTIPLLITGLLGLVFGPKPGSSGLGRIRFALVDEDDSMLTKFLRGSLNQGEASKYFDPVLLEREEALSLLRENKLSAAIIIPVGFTRAYLATTNLTRLELVKNPAQSIHPAVLEELLGALVTGLDAVKRYLGPELPDWQAVFEGEGDYRRVSELIVRAGDRLKDAKDFVYPPRIIYERQRGPSATTSEAGAAPPPAGPKSAGPKFNIFGYLLPGLSAMFLLFLAEKACRDVQVELQTRTLQRFMTLHTRLSVFVASKFLFCLVFLLLCSLIMLGGGGLIFRIAWGNIWALVLLTTSYCMFASGLMMLMPALFGNHPGGQAVSSMIAMAVGLAGGSAFPAEQLPAFLREHVTAFMPNFWYAEAVRAVVRSHDSAAWSAPFLKTAVVGIAFTACAAVVLKRRLEKGTPA
jgi:ABC-type multidrug transport system permease subunit